MDAKEELLSVNSLGTFQKRQLLIALLLILTRQRKLLVKSPIEKGKQRKWMVTFATLR